MMYGIPCIKANFKPFHMKNTFKFMFVALAMTIALASCGGGKTSGETKDTVSAQTPAPADTTQTAAPADSVGK